VSSFRKPITGKRFASPTWNKGRKTEGADSPIQFTASVQPLTNKELVALPEGQRERARFKLYTSFQLLTVVRGDSGHAADQVQIESEWYEITQVGIWKNDVIPHYKAIASLLG
jgi:hypothetical protein